jgi:hypothetical protein
MEVAHFDAEEFYNLGEKLLIRRTKLGRERQFS